MKKIFATLVLAAALVVGSTVPAQAAMATIFGNGGPGYSMVVKASNGTISTLPVGTSTRYITYVSVPKGRCITITNTTTTFQTFKRCGVTTSSWWSIPSTGNWIAKSTTS